MLKIGELFYGYELQLVSVYFPSFVTFKFRFRTIGISFSFLVSVKRVFWANLSEKGAKGKVESNRCIKKSFGKFAETLQKNKFSYRIVFINTYLF